MNPKFISILKNCLKVAAAIAGGVAAFFGINKLLDKPKEQETEEEVEGEETKEKEPLSHKIIKGIQLGQSVLSGSMGIVQGVNAVSNSINKILDPNYYNSGMSGNNWRGDSGLPYDTPVFRGKDTTGDNIYWVRRGNNVIEVW